MNSLFERRSGALAAGVLLTLTGIGCGATDDAYSAPAMEDEAETLAQTVADPGDGQDWATLCDDVYEFRAYGGANRNTPYTVPAGNEYHPQIMQDAPWGSAQVQAVGFRPITDNKKVLHHWILYAGASFLAGWAPGDEARPPYPDDVGMDMPNGARSLRLDMHYYNSGPGARPEQDRSGVAVCTVKGARLRPKHAAVTMSFTSFGPVLAPANKTNHQATSKCTVTAREPVHLMTAGPHAHKLATHMKFTVNKGGPNGREIVMHDEPFLFGEQGTYPLPGGEVVLNTGDVVTTTCTFSNPTNRNVTFGESTENEMCFNFAAYWPKGALACRGSLLGR